MKGAADPTGSQVQAWKINISGPPALILVFIGLFVFLFPFTPFFGLPPEPVETIPGTVPEQSTTSTEQSVTTVGETTTTVEYILPPAPYDYEVYDDSEICGGNAIEWYTEVDVYGWYIIIEVYNATSDTYIDSLEIDTNTEDRWYPFRPKLCEWEFFYDFPVSYSDGTYYVLYIYSYDDLNYSENALVLQYP